MTPGRALQAAEGFLFAPARAVPLAVLRIGLAAVLLGQALQVAPIFRELHHHRGYLRGPLMDLFAPTHMPALGRIMPVLERHGVSESLVLTGGGVLYLAGLVGLLLGWRTRACAVVAWFWHLYFVMIAPHTGYGADDFANIFLFYSLVAPVGAVWSLDRRHGRGSAAPNATNRLCLRMMQIHLCIAYLSTGVRKASGAQWYDGEAVWRSLMAQGYQWADFAWLARWPALAVLAGWMVLVIEVGYPLFIWPRRTRRIWVLAVVAMHAGIAVFMGLHVFGALMIVFTVALFGVSAEPNPGESVA